MAYHQVLSLKRKKGRHRRKENRQRKRPSEKRVHRDWKIWKAQQDDRLYCSSHHKREPRDAFPPKQKHLALILHVISGIVHTPVLGVTYSFRVVFYSYVLVFLHAGSHGIHQAWYSGGIRLGIQYSLVFVRGILMRVYSLQAAKRYRRWSSRQTLWLPAAPEYRNRRSWKERRSNKINRTCRLRLSCRLDLS